MNGARCSEAQRRTGPPLEIGGGGGGGEEKRLPTWTPAAGPGGAGTLPRCPPLAPPPGPKGYLRAAWCSGDLEQRRKVRRPACSPSPHRGTARAASAPWAPYLTAAPLPAALLGGDCKVSSLDVHAPGLPPPLGSGQQPPLSSPGPSGATRASSSSASSSVPAPAPMAASSAPWRPLCCLRLRAWRAPPAGQSQSGHSGDQVLIGPLQGCQGPSGLTDPVVPSHTRSCSPAAPGPEAALSHLYPGLLVAPLSPLRAWLLV